jgi:AcrR family transcriptional regulator
MAMTEDGRAVDGADTVQAADWQRRVVGRSLDGARQRSIDRGARFIRAAAKVLDRTNGESLTVQEVADEAGQSLRTLYQYFASKDDLLLAVHEEAARTFARMLRAAISAIDEPKARLAGALIAAGRIPAMHQSGADRGLSALRLQLTSADPTQLARAQQPMTSLFKELIEALRADSDAVALQVDPATYFISAVRSAFALSITLGNDYGIQLPDVLDLAQFCLNGIGVETTREWLEGVDHSLHLTGDDARSILRRLIKQPLA